MNFVYVFLLSAGIVITQLMVGGTRLVYSLPGYALIAAAALLSVFSFRRPRVAANGWCLGITAMVFAYLLARAASSPVDYLWWMDFYQMIACLTVYYLTTLYVTERGPRMMIISILLALAVAEVFLGLRQFTIGDNWMPFGFTRADYASRASGTLVSSIHFAGYLEAVGIFALSLGLWGSWPLWGRLLVSYVGLLCYLGVAMSGSRGGYGSSVFSLAVFAVLSLWVLRRSRPEKFIGIALIVALLSLATLGGAYTLMTKSNLLRQRLELIGKPDVRIYNWQAALDQFKLTPVVGTGAGTHLFYARFFRRPQLQADPIHAHSDYLEILAEYGLIGLLGMAAVIVFHLDNGLRGFSRVVREELTAAGPYGPLRSDALALNLGAICAVAAYLAHSVVDFNLHIPGNALTFAFIFGLLANPATPLSASLGDTPEKGINRLPFRLALPALGLWMAASGLPKFPGEYWCERANYSIFRRLLPEVVENASRAIACEPRNPFAYYYLAGGHLGLGLRDPDPFARRSHLEASTQASVASLQRFPQNEHALVRYARAQDALERYREGGVALQNAVALDPRLGTLRAEYARHLALVGRNQEAREQLAQARALSGQNLSPILGNIQIDESIPLEGQ